MTEERRTIKIANISIDVSDDDGDADQLEALERWLNKRYDSEEKRLGRIDTPVVALHLAYQLARELQEAKNEAEDQVEEFRATLERIIAQIESLTD